MVYVAIADYVAYCLRMKFSRELLCGVHGWLYW